MSSRHDLAVRIADRARNAVALELDADAQAELVQAIEEALPDVCIDNAVLRRRDAALLAAEFAVRHPWRNAWRFLSSARGREETRKCLGNVCRWQPLWAATRLWLANSKDAAWSAAWSKAVQP